MSRVVRLISPPTEPDVRSLHVGDTVYLDGIIFGIRDATQRRMFDEGVELPEDMRDHVCLHTAPNARKVGDRWEKICIGTTTSTRMEKYTPALIERYGVRGIIGKGGLLEGSLRAMQQFGAVYLAIVGGAAALETMQVEEIEAVHWEDLFPECLWRFRVRDFGPLIVAMDSHGRSLYAEVSARARGALSSVLATSEQLQSSDTV